MTGFYFFNAAGFFPSNILLLPSLAQAAKWLLDLLFDLEVIPDR